MKNKWDNWKQKTPISMYCRCILYLAASIIQLHLCHAWHPMTLPGWDRYDMKKIGPHSLVIK